MTTRTLLLPQVYSQLDGDSHVVNTAWAMLTLLTAGYHKRDTEVLHRAARFLMRMQEASGDWPQQHISGVFNRNCMITYANYRYGIRAAYGSAVRCFVYGNMWWWAAAMPDADAGSFGLLAWDALLHSDL